MHSFAEAFDLLLAHTPILPMERCAIDQAYGRVLRSPVLGDRAFPPFDRVMMDGVALRAVDLGSSRRFQRVGSAPAGQPAAILSDRPCVCLEVMTGAPLPIGADCIVPVEQISEAGADHIEIAESFEAVAGCFIHRCGSDARAGEILLRAGVQLGSRQIGVAASCGAAWLNVARLPKIAVMATGDELVAVDEKPEDHQIRQSNAYAITCALQRAGISALHSGTLRDEKEAAESALHEQLAACEWLILTGAISKGARDFVPGLLDALGCRRLFHGVAQRPGKPAGSWIGPAGQVIMALPGNPVSALTGLHAFVLPALAVASGLALPRPRIVTAQRGVRGLSGMTLHLPVVLDDEGSAQATPSGNSGDFIGLLWSDGFITMPPQEAGVQTFPYTPWL